MQHKFATEGTEQLGDEASEDVKSVWPTISLMYVCERQYDEV